MTFRLAAQESTLPGASLEEKFEVALGCGFDGIELSARGDGEFAARIGELRAAARAGVTMPTAVVHMDHFIGDFDPDRRNDACRQLKSMLTTIAEIDGVGVVTPHAFGLFSRALPPFDPPQDDRVTRANLLTVLADLAEHAAAEGVTVLLEPLNRFEDFVLNTLADAAWYAEQIDSPGLAVVADTFHMSIEEAHVGDAIRSHGRFIEHVQLGDSNRLEPGAGHYDWAETLAALDDIGYEGWLAMECRLSGTAEEVLPSVAALLSRGRR